ncbi:MAG: hypothetical protein U0183_00005, partial [Polyangiaceae bacterium]
MGARAGVDALATGDADESEGADEEGDAEGAGLVSAGLVSAGLATTAAVARGSGCTVGAGALARRRAAIVPLTPTARKSATARAKAVRRLASPKTVRGPSEV